MDLRTNQEIMGMQNRYSTEYGGHMFKGKDTFEEADMKGNNNIFNSLKTETTSNHSHDSSSLYQVKCSSKKKLQVDNSLFSYSSFKKAMDLRTHNRTVDGGRRTIFEDAEYFAKNHRYKLLPITLEHVDESIIQSEHNYSLFSLTSESEPEEDCSRMMDYSQIKEKNYKRRRTKFREGGEKELLECGVADGDENHVVLSSPILFEQSDSFADEPEPLEPDNLVQPLDLSGPLLAEEEKTDLTLRGRGDDSAEKSDEIARLDSDKENVGLELSGIRVTITRPDEKENYQPCDLFLNDIARLVPWLIDKDCFEVDILDRTCGGDDEFRKHRLYYVISESTWRLFQTSNERVILTNDRSLGQPLRKAEKGEKPSFLVFDQFSLAKCLAEYCQEIGGCFEYTCVEEGKNQELGREKGAGEIKNEESIKEAEVMGEVVEQVGDAVEVKLNVNEEKEIAKAEEEKSKETKVINETLQNVNEELEKNIEEMKEEKKVAREEVASDSNLVLPKGVELEALAKARIRLHKLEEKGQEVEKTPKKQSRTVERVIPPVGNINKKTEKKEAKGTKSKRTPAIQPKPKNSRITTRSKTTSESETSQKCDERVNTRGKRKRKRSVLPKAEPPVKVKKAASPEATPRTTRSGKVLKEAKANKMRTGKKGSAGRREGGEEEQGAPRRLRSQRVAQKQGGEKESTPASSRAKGRKR